MTKSTYCKVHTLKVKDGENIREVIDEAQVLNDGSEYHIEKIVKSLTKNKRLHYEVKWIGFTETTVEPTENIPRVLTELLDSYGDSSIPTTIKMYFESKSGIKYVVLGVENHEDLILPACSLTTRVPLRRTTNRITRKR